MFSAQLSLWLLDCDCASQFRILRDRRCLGSWFSAQLLPFIASCRCYFRRFVRYYFVSCNFNFFWRWNVFNSSFRSMLYSFEPRFDIENFVIIDKIFGWTKLLPENLVDYLCCVCYKMFFVSKKMLYISININIDEWGKLVTMLLTECGSFAKHTLRYHSRYLLKKWPNLLQINVFVAWLGYEPLYVCLSVRLSKKEKIAWQYVQQQVLKICLHVVAVAGKPEASRNL